MPGRPTIARSFIAALQRRGIEHVFANSGTDHAPIVEALAAMQSEGAATPQFHVVPHENTAMAMAQGYYVVSGKPAAVLVHVTVGTANTVCSLMNARRSNIPVLLVAGRNPLSQEGHAGSRSVPIHWGQDAFDQNALVREYTKWEHELRAYQNVDALVDRALTIAMNEPRGPVYLTLPREILADTDPCEPVGVSAATVPAQPSDEAMGEIAALLAAAQRPAIVTSTLGVDAAARRELDAIAERYSIPVAQTWPFAVNIRSDHAMNLRSSGADWLGEADVILAVDAAVPWVPRRFKPRADAVVIQVAADPAYAMYPYRDFPADRVVAGATLPGLRSLARHLEAQQFDSGRIERRRAAVTSLIDAARASRDELVSTVRDDEPIHAAWIATCVNGVTGDDAVIVNELGVPFEFLEFSDRSIYFGETTSGGLGTGLGAAIGAKLADPSRDVVCCVGDGSFMFGNPTPALLVSQALRTPVTVVVANNGMWYAVEHSTTDIYPDGAAAGAQPMPLTRFGVNPDYAAIAVACGAFGRKVTLPVDVEEALSQALERNRKGQAAVVEIQTAPGTR